MCVDIEDKISCITIDQAAELMNIELLIWTDIKSVENNVQKNLFFTR